MKAASPTARGCGKRIDEIIATAQQTKINAEASACGDQRSDVETTKAQKGAGRPTNQGPLSCVANYLKFDIANTPEPGKGANCTWKGVPVNCGPKGLPTDTNLLYHNNGDGSFTDVSESSGIAKVQGRYSMKLLLIRSMGSSLACLIAQASSPRLGCNSTASTML